MRKVCILYSVSKLCVYTCIYQQCDEVFKVHICMQVIVWPAMKAGHAMSTHVHSNCLYI